MPEVDVAPVFNDYKWRFAKKRLLETWLGGIRLVYDEENERVPCNLVVLQLGLALLPMVLGLTTTILQSRQAGETDIVSGLVCGGSMALIAFLGRTVVVSCVSRDPLNGDVEKQVVASALREEDVVDLSTWAGRCQFLFDTQSHQDLFKESTRVAVAFTLGLVFGTSSSRSSQIASVLSLVALSSAFYTAVFRHPMELSQWRPGGDSTETFFRAFHFILFVCVAGLRLSWLTVLLPVLWNSGMLPSVEVLVEWLLEQWNLNVFGATTSATSRRTVTQFLQSGVACLIVFGFLRMEGIAGDKVKTGAMLSVACVGAYTLARGLPFLVSVRNLRRSRIKTGVIPVDLKSTQGKDTQGEKNVGRKPQSVFTVHKTREGVVLLGLAVACFLLGTVSAGSNSEDTLNVAGVGVAGCAFLLSLVGWGKRLSKRPFICGIRRSGYVLQNTETTEVVWWRQTRVLVRFCVRFLLLCVVCMSSAVDVEQVREWTVLEQLVFSCVLHRGFRLVLNEPYEASLEVAWSCLLSGTYVGPSLPVLATLWSSTVGRMLFIGFCANRASGFFKRMHFAWLHVHSAARSKKLRLRPSLQSLSRLFLPTTDVLLAVVACILDAPLIPLAGTPIFSVGFPRPKRLWPSLNENIGSRLEAAYYAQVYPGLLEAIPRVCREETVHPSRHGETMLLVRFEKMIAWITVLEAEYGYLMVSVRGLELQEPTSCHNVEANAMDALIEESLAPQTRSDAADRPRQTNCGWIAHDKAAPIAGVLEPLCKVQVETYSHSNVSLTGVIDHPEFLRLMDKAFLYTLVWYVENPENDDVIASTLARRVPRVGEEYFSSDDGDKFPDEWQAHCEKRFQGGPETMCTVQPRQELIDAGPEGPSGPMGDDFDIDALLDEIEDEDFLEPEKLKACQGVAVKSSLSTSIKPEVSSTDNLDFEEEGEEEEQYPKAKAVQELPPAKELTKILPREDRDMSWKALPMGQEESEALNILDDLDTPRESWSGREREEKKRQKKGKDQERQGSKSRFDSFTGVSTMLTQLLRSDSDQRLENPLSARSWGSNTSSSSSLRGHGKKKGKSRTAKVESEESLALAGNQARSPLSPTMECKDNNHGVSPPPAFFEKVVHHHEPKPNEGRIVEMRASQPTKHSRQDRRKLVEYLFAVVNRVGLGGQKPDNVGSVHVLDCFAGKFPKSLELRWLKESSELETLVMSAFRHAFKLSIDAYLLGDPDPSFHDWKEIFGCLETYEREWYIGDSQDLGWASALRRETKHLVSLTGSKRGSAAGMLQLTLQREKATLCELKSEIVRGLWASLVMELFYFTNDDDERYSIQAHPYFLRNLVVQAAEPPLGYPVFEATPQVVTKFHI